MNSFESMQRMIVTTWIASVVNIDLSYNKASKNIVYPYGIFYLTSDFDRYFGGKVKNFQVKFNLFDNSRSSETLNDIADIVKTDFDDKILAMSNFTMIRPMDLTTEEFFKNDSSHWQNTMIFSTTIRS